MAKAPGKTSYVVQRLNWCSTNGQLLRLPGSTRLQTHATLARAERDRAEREGQVRGQVNPFLCAGEALSYQARFDEGRLCDWVLDAGLEPPPAGKKGRNWAKWYVQSADHWTDYQRGKVWEALDKVCFFEVVERPARPVVYLVVRIGWRYNDDWYEAEPEGGKVFPEYYAFRDRARAVEDCEENNKMAREVWAEDVEEDATFDVLERWRRQEGELALRPPEKRPEHEQHLLPAEEVPFWEVIEVEVEP